MDKRENQQNLMEALSGLSNDVAAEVRASGALTSVDIKRVESAALARQLSISNNNDLMGLLSESIQSVSGKLAQHNFKVERMRRDQEAKANSGRTIELLALLESGQYGAYIASAVFDSMSDEEITDFVAEIEAKTGKPFEEYAKEILGDAMPKRNEGESEADYQRRVAKELTEEMLDTSDPNNIRFKPGYEDDPVAGFLKKNEEYNKGAKVVADDANARFAATGEVTKEDEQDVENEADRGVGTGWQLEGDLQNDALQSVAAESQEELRNEDSGDSLAVSSSSNFFDSFPASPMETASAKGRMDFAAAASPDQPEQTPDADITAPVFTGTDFTRNA